MEDHNIGKYFKKTLEDYSSPIDGDEIFRNIEEEISPPKKDKRRSIFLLLGCLPIAAALVTLLWMLGYHFKSPKETIALDQPTLEKSETNTQSLQLETTKTDRTYIPNKTIAENHNNNLATTANVLTNEYVRKKSPAPLIGDHQETQSNYTTITNVNEQIIPPVISETHISGKKKSSSTNNYITVERLQLIEFFPTGLKKRELPFAGSVSLQPIHRRPIWSLGLSAGYVNTVKNNKFHGVDFQDWFQSYSSDEDMYPGFMVSLDANYQFQPTWSFIGSLQYLQSQEAQNYNIVNQTMSYDGSLADTIFVDRDLTPVDTIFGQYITTIDSIQAHLVTTTRMVSLSLGIGKHIPLSGRVTLVPQFMLTTTLSKRISGNLFDPDNTLVSREAFVLDNEPVFNSGMIFGAELGCSLDYQFNDHYSLNLNSAFRFNVNNFSSSSIISERRHFWTIGLGLSRTL